MSARDTVEAVFFALADDPSADNLARQLAAHPDASGAALAYLRARHVDGVEPRERWESLAAFHQVLELLVVAGGDPAVDALIEIALAAGHLRELRPLGHLMIGAVEPERLARGLIDALAADGAPARRERARELVYQTFDAVVDEYPCPPALRASLTAALATAA